MFSLMKTVSNYDIFDLVFKIVFQSAVLIINSDMYIKSVKIMDDFFDNSWFLWLFVISKLHKLTTGQL